MIGDGTALAHWKEHTHIPAAIPSGALGERSQTGRCVYDCGGEPPCWFSLPRTARWNRVAGHRQSPLFDNFRMFSLSDEMEAGYWEIPAVYPRSLLYLVSGLVGSTIKVVVTATNSGGSTSQASAATGVIAALLPKNTSLPSIAGSLIDGQTLGAATGGWQWRKNRSESDVDVDVSLPTPAPLLVAAAAD